MYMILLQRQNIFYFISCLFDIVNLSISFFFSFFFLQNNSIRVDLSIGGWVGQSVREMFAKILILLDICKDISFLAFDNSFINLLTHRPP